MTDSSPRAVAPRVILAADTDALIEATADRVTELLSEAVRARGVASLVVAGGRTPRALYRLLANRSSERRPPWSRVKLFMGDERWVPADHADSNQRMVRESLLTDLPDSPAFFPMPTDGTEPALDAARYQACLAQEVPECDGHLPRFDVILLGMGDDGHTASLFPGTSILDERESVAAVHVPRFDSWRLSLTLPVLNAARHVLFLVTGADKAATLARVLGDGPRRDLPASLVNPREGEVEWHLDRPAAALLGPLVPGSNS